MIDPNYADIQRRRDALAAFGSGFIPSKIPTFPEAEDIEDQLNDLRSLARHLDPLVYAIGQYIAANVSRSFDLTAFDDVLSIALMERVIPEIEAAAERIRDEERERV